MPDPVLTPEPWDWRKALYGMVDPVRVLKDGFTLLRMLAIGIMAYVLFVGGVALWKNWVPAKKVPKPIPPVTITDCPNGKCEISSGDKQTKIGVITW